MTKVRVGLIVGLAVVVAAGSLVPASAAKKKKMVVVGKDAPDDWGKEVDPTLTPLGEVLAQELVEASIGMADAKTVDFVIKLKSLPPSGGVPEITRYLWNFSVDGEFRELDGKFTNYSRGACDPTAGNCPPPRDPGLHPFAVRGNCVTDNVVICEELGIVEATFDAAAATITIPVPLALMKAKPGSKIAPAVSDAAFLGNVAAISSAFYSVNTEPHDGILITKTFVVPR